MYTLPRTYLTVEIVQTERIEAAFGSLSRDGADIGTMHTAEAHPTRVVPVGSGRRREGSAVGASPGDAFVLLLFGGVVFVLGIGGVFLFDFGHDEYLKQVRTNVLMQTIDFVDIVRDG